VGTDATQLLAALKEEREKFEKADTAVMQGYVDALIECGEYPKEVNPRMKATHLSMVEGWGAYWHQWKGKLECPTCGADFRDLVNGPPGKREISIYSRARDRTVAQRCPDCKHEWAV